MSSADRAWGLPEWPGGSVQFALELPSTLDVIEGAVAHLVARCRDFAFDGSRLNLNFRVGVTEALANAILYGNRRDPRKSVRVEVELDSTAVILHVVDQGEGFDPERLPDPTAPENLMRSSGRGVFLLRNLMDEVEFNERGNAVRLVLRRDPPQDEGTPP